MSEKTLLLVDDDKHILRSLRRVLRKEDYALLTAESGQEGLSILEKHRAQVVMTDQRMPEMTGVEFLEKVKELYPTTVRVVISGFAEISHIVESINQGEIYRFIGKPWNDDELKATIRQCMEHYEILRMNRELMERTRSQNLELRNLNDNLESMVEERTRSLQLSQEVLEKLPIAVVGVSREREIVLTNSAAKVLIPALYQMVPGSDIDRILPEEAVDHVMRALEGEKPNGHVSFRWGEKLLNMRLQLLGPEEEYRGCILVFGDEQDILSGRDGSGK